MTRRAFTSLIRVTDSGCWEWLGDRWRYGHALFRPSVGGAVYAERYSCELTTGAAPLGQLRRHCDNHRCVRYAPGHWELSNGAVRRAAGPVFDRSDAELAPKEVDEFRSRWQNGTSMGALRKRFRLSWPALQRLASKIREAA